MTLQEIIRVIEGIASRQPSVKMLVRYDAYKLNTCQSARYGAFGWQQLQHECSEDGFKNYRFNLYYVDRMLEDESNAVMVQSAADSILDNIIRTIADGGAEVGSWTTTPIRQRFADDCAGAYASVSIKVPSTLCAEDYADYNNDFNKDFLII